MPGKKYKFPAPADYAHKDPVVLCPATRVMKLYNQATGKKAKRVAKNMTKWFIEEAKKNGWADCRFLPTVQSKHSAGCALLNPASVTVTLNQITISLKQSPNQ